MTPFGEVAEEGGAKLIGAGRRAGSHDLEL